MNWEQARKLLPFARVVKKTRDELQAKGRAPRPKLPDIPRATSLCVASGKGGTGKSVFTASIAARICRLGRTLIMDADMGIGNAHILQGVAPERSFVELVAGTASPHEVVARCNDRLDLIAAGSGVSSMAELSAFEMHRVAEALEQLETEYSYLIVDSAAGVSNQTVAFASASDLVVVITTPAVTAMTDAYAFIKVLLRSNPQAIPLLVVNRAHSTEEAQSVVKRMGTVCERFLSRSPRFIGWIPFDETVIGAINGRQALVDFDPTAPAARALEKLALVLAEEFDRQRARGIGHALMGRVAYSPKLA
ncbi:MAG: flagellar biosynthesis protein FlhG [Planctomycetota bacterium]|jgi:flagellar biosynthesis protein FlhG